jgi:uncharacterized protein (TIGR03000 family)
MYARIQRIGWALTCLVILLCAAPAVQAQRRMMMSGMGTRAMGSPTVMGQSTVMMGRGPVMMGQMMGQSPIMIGQSPFLMGQSPFLMGQSSFGMRSSNGGGGSGGGGYGGSGSGGSGSGGGGSGGDYSYQPGYGMSQMSAYAGDQNAMTKELPHRTGVVRSAPPDAAVIKIDLPDDSARVRIDGQDVTSAGKTRYFVTPELNKGKEYSYAIKIQWTKNGEQVTQERNINVEAGKIAKVNFTTTLAAH